MYHMKAIYFEANMEITEWSMDDVIRTSQNMPLGSETTAFESEQETGEDLPWDMVE